MNLQDDWNNLSNTLNKGNDDFLADQQMIKMESKGAYETLVKRLKYKMLYCVVFTVVSMILALLATDSAQYIFFAFFLSFLSGCLMMGSQLITLPATLDYTSISKSLISEQLLRIKKLLKLERYWGYLFVPLSPLGGYLIGQLQKGKDLTMVFQQTNWWLTAPLLILVSIAGIYLAEKMNGVAFKGYLKKLEGHQQQLEN